MQKRPRGLQKRIKNATEAKRNAKANKNTKRTCKSQCKIYLSYKSFDDSSEVPLSYSVNQFGKQYVKGPLKH